MLTKAGKRRDPPMPGDVVERRGLWKIRVRRSGVVVVVKKNKQEVLTCFLFCCCSSFVVFFPPFVFSFPICVCFVHLLQVVGVNNAAPSKGSKGGSSRQDAIERTLYKARKQLKRSTRMREGKNRSYQNGGLKGGQDFSRSIRRQQQNTDLEVDDRYLSHEEDKMHQLANYFEARYAATTEQVRCFLSSSLAE